MKRIVYTSSFYYCLREAPRQAPKIGGNVQSNSFYICLLKSLHLSNDRLERKYYIVSEFTILPIEYSKHIIINKLFINVPNALRFNIWFSCSFIKSKKEIVEQYYISSRTGTDPANFCLYRRISSSINKLIDCF